MNSFSLPSREFTARGFTRPACGVFWLLLLLMATQPSRAVQVMGNADTNIVVQGAGDDFVAWEAEGKGEVIMGAPENWTATEIAGASHGRALVADGANSTGDSPHSFAQYRIQFTGEGTYYLYYRWRADPARTAGDVFTANSFWIGATFGDFRTPGSQAEFVTSSVNDTSAPANNAFDWRREPDPLAYTVTAAELAAPQVLTFGTREAGLTLDRVVLSTSPDLTPAQLDALLNSGEVPAAPELHSATGSAAFNEVTLEFSRPLAASSVTADRFTLDGGVTVSAAALDADDPRFVHLTTSAQTPGVVYTVSVTGVMDTTGGTIAPGSTISFTAWRLVAGWARKEIYFGIPGGTVFDLQADLRYQARTPDRVEYVRGFQLNQAPQTDNYGAHLEALFTPMQAGVWDFFINNDDEAELLLSTDETEGNLSSLGVFPLSPPAFDESLFVSSPNLSAGSSYLLVGLLKQAGGDVYLNVGARPSGASMPAIEDLPVLEDFIATYVNPDLGKVVFDAQPQSVTVRAGERARLSVEVTPASENPVYYRWELNGTPIPGATRRVYVTPVLDTADSGQRYACVVSVAGVETRSEEATVTVLPGDPSNLQPYIGVNFVGGGGGGVGASLGPTEVAGVVLQEHWNNVTGFQPVDLPLHDAAGQASPVRLGVVTASETWYSGTLAVGDADGALLHGLITYGSSTDPLDVVFSGVPAGDYNVYVYSVGFTFSPDYRQRVLVIGAETSPELKVIAETGLAYTTDPGWRRMQSTNPDARDTGNYVLFENVNPASDGTLIISLAWEGEGGNTHQPALNAIQLVSVTTPGPSSIRIDPPVIAGSDLTLSWTGGVGPFAVLRRDALGSGSWTEVSTSTERSATVPMSGSMGFLQIEDRGR